jgi:hypothetical protein
METYKNQSMNCHASAISKSIMIPEILINGWLACSEPLAANVSKESGFLHSLWSHPLQSELANGEVLSASAFIKEVREDFRIAGGQSGANVLLFDDFAMGTTC